MRKRLKDELDNKNIVVEYICPKCGKRQGVILSFFTRITACLA